jgi:hypothetical protein
MGPLSGGLSDRYGAKHIVIAGIALGALTFFLMQTLPYNFPIGRWRPCSSCRVEGWASLLPPPDGNHEFNASGELRHRLGDGDPTSEYR